jgi:hypothetical protein
LTYAPGHAIYPGISATSINPAVSPEPSTRTFIDVGGENDTATSFIFLNFSNQFSFPQNSVGDYPVGFVQGDVVNVSGEMTYETSYQAYVMNVTNITHSPSSTFPTSTPVSSQTPTANVTAVLSNAENTNGSYSGDYLSINGTVTNNSPNVAYNVGIKVTALESTPEYTGTAINVTIPITSATYAGEYTQPGLIHALTTLTPYQSVPVVIALYPLDPNETPALYDINVTLAWSNHS